MDPEDRFLMVKNNFLPAKQNSNGSNVFSVLRNMGR